MPIDKRVNSAAEALADVAGRCHGSHLGLRRRGLSQRADPRPARARAQGADAGRQLGHAPLLAHPRADRGRARAQGRVQRGARPGQGPLAVRAVVEGRARSSSSACRRARSPSASAPAGRASPRSTRPVGFGTELTRGKEVRRFEDRDYVLEDAIKGDLALVRADTADLYGNLTFRYAQMNFAPGHGHGREAGGGRGARRAATSRSRTSACSCRGPTSTAS